MKWSGNLPTRCDVLATLVANSSQEHAPMSIQRTTPQVQHVTQTHSDLCWAASIRMTMTVRRNNPAQTQDWTDEKISKRTFYEFRNIPQFVHVIKSALENYGARDIAFKNGFPDQATIEAMISSNRPIIVGIEWNNGDGHVMVIGGIGTDGTNTPTVAVNDPGEGAEQQLQLADFSKGIYQNSTHKWRGWFDYK